jgi:periplasmic divalent cation tolerance protein
LTATNYPALEEMIRELHPYDLPEIIALPLSHGLPDYLNWVVAETIQ